MKIVNFLGGNNDQKEKILAALTKKIKDVGEEEKYNIEGNLKNDYPFIFAIFKGDIATVKKFLVEGIDINVLSYDNVTPLLWSIFRFKTDLTIFNLLLDYGADVNMGSDTGTTPLMLAAKEDNLEMIKILLEKGADITGKDSFGDTALVYASENNSKTVIPFLIDNGLDINVKHYELGTTPLIKACFYEYSSSFIKYLLEKGADVNIQCNEGNTALMWAAKKDDEITVELLIENGADTNLQNNEGYTALTIACDDEVSNMDTIKILVENGADVNIRSKNNNCPLTLALSDGHYTIAKYLIEKGANIDICYDEYRKNIMDYLY